VSRTRACSLVLRVGATAAPALTAAADAAPPVWDRFARILIEAPAVLIDGHTERSHDAFNVIVHRAEAVSAPAVARHHRR
jgi:hypothetical protein